jgi:hypothetical protein
MGKGLSGTLTLWPHLQVFSFRSAQAQQASFQAIAPMLKQARTTAHIPARAKAVDPSTASPLSPEVSP